MQHSYKNNNKSYVSMSGNVGLVLLSNMQIFTKTTTKDLNKYRLVIGFADYS